jgi:hypothetical protein
MGLWYEGATANYKSALEIINYFFTAIFFVEMCIKFVAMGL